MSEIWSIDGKITEKEKLKCSIVKTSPTAILPTTNLR
jgi:hypothetical protein